jgi:hypothetical protein
LALQGVVQAPLQQHPMAMFCWVRMTNPVGVQNGTAGRRPDVTEVEGRGEMMLSATERV